MAPRETEDNAYAKLDKGRAYRKIPKISPGSYIFQEPFLRVFFLRGLYSEGLMYGGKFAFQNQFG